MSSRDIRTLPAALHWPAATAIEPPAPGVVRLWCTLLRCEAGALAGWERMLSAEESARASRFRTGELRRRFVVSRGLLRSILGASLHQAAEEVRFDSDDQGKPRVLNESGLEFNLAHTGDLMIVALTRGFPVGVDVERVRSLKDPRGIARRFFTARESDWLEGRQGMELDRAFFSLWTRKEAILKGTGEGISNGLQQLELLDAGGELLAAVPHGPEGGNWSLVVLEPAAGFVGAVALPVPIGAVRLETATFRPG